MTDKKLTDNEIIKALECCTDWCGEISCWDCPLKNTGCIYFDKLKDTLDLINRQKAEIERLNNLTSASAISRIADIAVEAEKKKPKFLYEIKTETAKEFAEIVKEYNRTMDGIILTSKDIDDLVESYIGR